MSYSSLPLEGYALIESRWQSCIFSEITINDHGLNELSRYLPLHCDSLHLSLGGSPMFVDIFLQRDVRT